MVKPKRPVLGARRKSSKVKANPGKVLCVVMLCKKMEPLGLRNNIIHGFGLWWSVPR